MAQYYTTGRICQILGIKSKMTLVRLEKRGIINPPPTQLARNRERHYSEENFQQIKEYWEAELTPNEPKASPSRRKPRTRGKAT
jgi:DNA-binding transcriptional MerR regulator